MTRTVFVFLMAALVCLALTGLRVAMLERLTPPEPQVSPRTIKDPPPDGVVKPREYYATLPAPAERAAREPALLWAGALREPPTKAGRRE
jgi:hypothetical protein